MYLSVITCRERDYPQLTQPFGYALGDLRISEFFDADMKGCAWNHLRAIKQSAKFGERTIIIEDDAMLMPDFAARALEIADKHPDDIVCFYLGRGTPVSWQSTIKRELDNLNESNEIILNKLLNCVCYSPTVEQCLKIEKFAKNREINQGTMIDELISKAIKCDVVYPIPSLVDHLDNNSVVPHVGFRNIARHAWRAE